MEVAQGVANACYEEGRIESGNVESLNLSDATTLLSPNLFDADEMTIELALCSNSRTVSSVGRSLGWRPTRGEQAWKHGFRDDFHVLFRKDGSDSRVDQIS